MPSSIRASATRERPGAGPSPGRRRAEPAFDLASLPTVGKRTAARARIALAAFAFGLILAGAVFGPWLAPYDPNAILLGDAMQTPSLHHLFGTDQLGRDVFTRALVGARVSLAIAACAVAVAGTAGGLAGLVAGYRGGWADTLVMRIADIQLALPALILALVLTGAIGYGIGNLVIVLSLANWARFARVMRSEALSLRTCEFVLLAQLAGASSARVVLRHIAPNVAGTFIVLATLDIGTVIILEATLSFLGLGVQPPTPSWGGLMADGRGYLETAWWICTLPGALLMLTVLSANLIGDALRDRLSPSLARRW